MKLNDEQRNKILQKLQNPSWGCACPVCKSAQWNVSDTIFELREFNSGSLVVSDQNPIYPVIPMTCTNCGNTIFLNAIIMGALEPRKLDQAVKK